MNHWLPKVPVSSSNVCGEVHIWWFEVTRSPLIEGVPRGGEAWAFGGASAAWVARENKSLGQTIKDSRYNPKCQFTFSIKLAVAGIII